MYISKVITKNFRLLRDSSLDLRQELSLLIGKNNSGKTSLFVLFEKFFKKSKHFSYDDFSLALREKIHSISADTEVDDLYIRMILEVQYSEEDNLDNISEFILDLDPNIKHVKILFECTINKAKLLKEIPEASDGEERKRLIIKNLGKYLEESIYVIDDLDTLANEGSEVIPEDTKASEDEPLKAITGGIPTSVDAPKAVDIDEYLKKYHHRLVPKKLNHVKKLINFHVIHARRNVSSSEESSTGKKALSSITTEYFNSKNDTPNTELTEIDKLLLETDQKLDTNYESFFDGFLRDSKNFLDLDNLNVRSNIQSSMLFDNSSQVTYGSDDCQLPENLNGLGYLNILFLLLQIEIKKADFKKQAKDISLLFIEEPEAHTHPQMQYIFANEIQKILKEISGLQTLITSHSSHIVSQSNFKDIRYLQKCNDNIKIKNFHTELEEKYADEQSHFKFLEQYLDIQAAELFFASKVIFIEGITERMLLPYFIHQLDEDNKGVEGYMPLESQNISILEVGANATMFAHFLEFMNIKTLIITDIDTGDKDASRGAVAVQDEKSNCTTNESIRYFLKSPDDIHSDQFKRWFKKLLKNSLDDFSGNIKLSYQTEESEYHARSFEDAFININKETIKLNIDDLHGLKNKARLDEDDLYIYELTNNILDKKSGFASSLLYLALTKDGVRWKIPRYIKEGLKWIGQNDSI